MKHDQNPLFLLLTLDIHPLTGFCLYSSLRGQKKPAACHAEELFCAKDFAVVENLVDSGTLETRFIHTELTSSYQQYAH